VVLTLLAGCQHDEIQSYTVPRIKAPQMRLVGAIFPQREKIWFFKLFGPAELVAEHKQEFDEFLKSVKFTGKDDPPLEFTAPRGWRDAPLKEMRYKAFFVDPHENQAELTIIKLGPEAGDILDNVNRWRGQVGLPELAPKELDRNVEKSQINNVSVTLIDVTGTSRGRKQPPMMAKLPPLKANLPPRFKAPQGWQPFEHPMGLSVASFRVEKGKQVAEVTITKAGGSVVENIKRWRTQVGLPKGSDQEALKGLREITVAGASSPYVDLIGPDGGGGGRRILGVVHTQGGVQWFVKMIGPADLVGEQKTAFESFVQSLQFGE
jgi:hypothetical protein